MSPGINLLLAGLAFAAVCVTAAAATKRQADTWNYYHFDGHGFVAGRSTDGSAFVAVRDRTLPVMVTGTARIEAVPLQSGKGAIAGICYIQSSGGKLAPGPGYAPYPRMPVRITSDGKVVATVEADEQGYFVATLAAGRYTVAGGIARVEIKVEKDTTTLVPLRAGKRMVD